MPSYKDEKRKSWFCQFYYTDIHGQKKLKKKRGFSTKREADAFEREFLSASKFTDDITFNTLLDSYLDDAKTRLKPTTYSQREYVLNKQIRPVFADLKIKDITPITIRKWQNSLISSGYKRTYQRQLTAQMSAILNYAVKYYGLAENPLKVTGHIGKSFAESFDFWTLDEYNQFIDVCDNESIKTMVIVLFWTGMRKGELLALTPNDIDREHKRISISKTKGRTKDGTVIQSPKTEKSNRTIDVTQYIIDILDEYISRTMAKPTDEIFPFNDSTLGISIKRICEKNNLRTITVHQLRHSHRSFCISVLGASPLYIKERLGHDRIETTLRTYSHLYKQVEDEYISQMALYQEN